MLGQRTILVLFITLFSGLVSSHAHEKGVPDAPSTVSRDMGAEENAVRLYREGIQFLFLGEIETAERRMLASVERNPAFVPAHKSLCAIHGTKSARHALPHCQAWARYETKGVALDYARKTVQRLEISVGARIAQTP